MEQEFMKLATKKYIQSREEKNIKERDKLYDQVDICRQFARFSESYGERALKEFFEEISKNVKEDK